MRYPSGDPVAGERIELKRRARGQERSIWLRSGRSSHNEQQVRCGALQVLVENLTRIFLERGNVAKYDDPSLRHHWRRGKKNSKGLGVDLGGSSRIQVEVPGSGIQSSLYELPDRIVFLVIVLPPNEVSGLEWPAL